MAHYKLGRSLKYAPGFEFGNLTLIERYGNRAVLECKCGNVIEVSFPALTQGGKTNCGCVAAEQFLDSTPTNSAGMLYWTWVNMVARCHDEHNKSYKDYGARGIAVCDRWRYSFDTFSSDLGARPEGTTLDRIDGDKGYEPGNCRWATAYQQAMNKRKRQKMKEEEKEKEQS